MPSTPPPVKVWFLAGELGFIIALPALILVLIGVKLDAKLNTTPFFIILALPAAMAISIALIIRKIKRINL